MYTLISECVMTFLFSPTFPLSVQVLNYTCWDISVLRYVTCKVNNVRTTFVYHTLYLTNNLAKENTSAER